MRISSILAVAGFAALTPALFAQLTYLEADSGNTTGLATGWNTRTDFGLNNTVHEARDEADDASAAELATTITGLTPGATYTVHVNFWDKASNTTESWGIRAGFTSGSLTQYCRDDDATTTYAGDSPVAALPPTYFEYTSPPPQYYNNAQRFELLSAVVGETTADGSGNIVVYVDDRSGGCGANDRTWYDGVSYGAGSYDDPPAPLTDWSYQLTYVDGDSTNLTPSAALAGPDSYVDNLWHERTPYGNGATENIYQAGGSEDADDITMTLTGLDANTDYEVWVYFWDGTYDGGDWCVSAGFTAGTKTAFVSSMDAAEGSLPAALSSATVATHASVFKWTTPPLTAAGDRLPYLGHIGTGTSDGSGELTFLVDSVLAVDSNQRTWFDGAAYISTAAASDVTDWAIFTE